MNKFKAVFMAAIMAVSLTACSKDSIKDTSEPIKIGSDINGYITSDTEWAIQKEEKDNIISFSSLQEDGSYTFVTFQTIDMKDSDRNIFTLEYITDAYAGFYEENEIDILSKKRDISVGIYPAYLINAEYMNDDTLTDISSESFIFFDENHNLHIITVEGSPAAVEKTSALTESYKFDPRYYPETVVRQSQDSEEDYDGDFSPYED